MKFCWVKRRHLASVLPGFLPPQASHFPSDALYSAPSHELFPSSQKQIRLHLQTHPPKKNRGNTTISQNLLLCPSECEFYGKKESLHLSEKKSLYHTPEQPFFSTQMDTSFPFLYANRGIKVSVRTVLCCPTRHLIPSL